MAGDFHCYDGHLDKMGGSVSIDIRLTDLKSVSFLRNAWRLKHPRDRQFTWVSSDFLIASRLDSFLISRYLCEQVVSCEIHPCVYPDHDFVYIELDLHSVSQRGRGVWKFNNSLLQDQKFCSSVSDLIDRFVQLRSSFPSDLIMWDRLKHEIKCFTINYSRERWKQLSLERILLVNRLSFLKRRLAAGCDVKTEIRHLETLLMQLFDQQLQGSKIRSRVKWIEEGETPSKYFFRLENEQHAKVFVSSVFDSSGAEVSSLPEMMEAHETFTLICFHLKILIYRLRKICFLTFWRV